MSNLRNGRTARLQRPPKALAVNHLVAYQSLDIRIGGVVVADGMEALAGMSSEELCRLRRGFFRQLKVAEKKPNNLIPG
jgi:hypothetical protein